MTKLGLTVLLKVAEDIVIPAVINAIKKREDGKEVVSLTAFERHGGTRLVEDVEEGEGVDKWQMPGIDAPKPEQKPSEVHGKSEVSQQKPALGSVPTPPKNKE